MLKSLRRLSQFVLKYRSRLVGGIGLFFLARIFESAVPMFLMVGINRVSVGDTNLWLPITGIVGAVAIRFVLVSWARIAVRRAGLLVAFDLRNALYRHLQCMGPRFFTKYAIGDMMTRAIADISLIQRFISFGTIMIVIILFASLAGIGCMFYLSPSLALLVLPPLPFVLLYTWRASHSLGLSARAVQERLSDLSTHVQENLSGIRTIQAMVQESNEIKRFQIHNQAYSDAFYWHSKVHSLMHAIMPTIAAASTIIILGYGGSQVLNNELSVGAFAAFFFYVNMVVQPFYAAGMILSLIQRAAVASQRLFEVYQYKPEMMDSPSPKANVPEVIRGEISIRNLSFQYAGTSNPVLQNLSFKVTRGEMIAIMGRVGCGKSTLLQQFVRMLDTPARSIFIDDHDVVDYPLSQLRSQIVLVPQDPFLFAESLRANITYDTPNRSIDQIWQAAESADLLETIEEMPERMDTIVGERGITLSGGQKQRTTLARGFIRHAPILVLDDCFSSIDTETEENILSELRRLRNRQTTILVSHRVSTARHANRILVMNEGQIVEMGTHNELIASGGYYAELERIQREGTKTSDHEEVASVMI